MVNGSAVLKQQQQQHHETVVKNESHAINECNSNHLSHGSHFVIFFLSVPKRS